MKFKGVWVPENRYKKYREYVKNAKLENFKTHPDYIGVVGNDARDKETTLIFYEYLISHVKGIKLKRFFKNDNIGSPIIHEVSKGLFVSCGTLRYLVVLYDISRLFLNDFSNIVEIGAGYGGQCNIILEYDNTINYTCIDIPEATGLIKKYLDYFNREVTVESCDNITIRNYDLVISDYCLGEMDKEGVDFYFDKVIKYCNYAYFTLNSNSPVFDYIFKKLYNLFSFVRITPELPATSKVHKNKVLIAKK